MSGALFTAALRTPAIFECVDIQAHIMERLPSDVIAYISSVCKSMYVGASDALTVRQHAIERHDETITRLRQQVENAVDRQCVYCTKLVTLSSSVSNTVNPRMYEAFGGALALTALRLSFALAEDMRSHVRMCIHRGEIVYGQRLAMNICLVHREEQTVDAQPVVHIEETANILRMSVRVCLNGIARKLQLEVCNLMPPTCDITECVDAHHM